MGSPNDGPPFIHCETEADLESLIDGNVMRIRTNTLVCLSTAQKTLHMSENGVKMKLIFFVLFGTEGKWKGMVNSSFEEVSPS